MSSGYSQDTLHENSRDTFCIVLPQGKFRFCVLPQGAAISSDYFNITTDPDLRGAPGVYKNIDDILVSASNLQMLEQRMERMLEVCLKKNMKLHPEKIQLGRRVEFGGVSVEACRAKGDNQKRVYLSPSEDKLAAFLDLKTPESKVEVQRACGMIAQLKKFCPGVMLEFPLLQSLSAHNKVFTWNEALQSEFDKMKQAMRETIKLSPLDLNKKIFCFTDAAVKVGMAYILVQKKREEDDDKDPKHGYLIVSCDSTTFRRAQCQYSPFEAELLSISWMCEKEDYNLRAAPTFKIFNVPAIWGPF